MGRGDATRYPGRGAQPGALLPAAYPRHLHGEGPGIAHQRHTTFTFDDYVLVVNVVNRYRHDERTAGQRVADSVTGVFGSWRFIIIQTAIGTAWIAANAIAVIYRWDPYPFILLNLLFSTQAAYAASLILLSQNRQADTDRVKAEHDYRVNRLALQYLIVWHRDAHGEACQRVQQAQPIVHDMLTELGREG